MDGAQAIDLYSIIAISLTMSRRTWGLVWSDDVNHRGLSPSADLGGSSKYSNAIFED
jgi:hypothetical protein